MKRVYKIAGLSENPQQAAIIEDGVSKIANISYVEVSAGEGTIAVEIASDHGVMEALIQHVVHKSDPDFHLELLEETND